MAHDRRVTRAIALAALVTSSAAGAQSTSASALVETGFIFERAPFASAHASTIAEASRTLVAAWYGGTREGASDVGIWMSRYEDGRWTPPTEVATGVRPDGARLPCWNPVLFQPRGGPLQLYYKVGPTVQRWWGMVIESRDAGRSWSAPRRLPDGILGPIKNKPIQLADGRIVSPSSTESRADPSTWRVHFELSADTGRTWRVVAPKAAPNAPDAIQPSVLVLGNDRLLAVGRTREGRIFETTSTDGGSTWSALRLGVLPNPNAGTDALTLADGRHLIVYNHSKAGRTPLNVAVSRDGHAWEPAAVLEDQPGEYSYPAVIQTRDGLIHITYTWRRERIKHVVLDPRRLQAKR